MTPQVLLCGYLLPSAWGQGFGKCRSYWADLKRWVPDAGLRRRTRRFVPQQLTRAALCYVACLITLTTSAAIAHDGPEAHKPGEQPVVHNGTGPQVVYGEVNPAGTNATTGTTADTTTDTATGHLHKTELKQGEFKDVSGFGTAAIQNQQEPKQEQEPQEPEPKKESIASSFWPWTNKNSNPPPEFKPYRLPTMEGDSRSYHGNLPPLVKAPAIDPDLVFNSVMTCYPAPSNFNIDVELRGQLRSAAGGDDLFETTDIGSNDVGIVARMPIYSHTEIDRERDREFNRRTVTAASVAKFVAAVATRNHAIRELALHRSLEARAAIRVQQGIVAASEQVTYLEKVASGQRALIKAEAEIMESRLAMAALCDPAKQEHMSQYLRHVSAVPKRRSPATE